MRTYRRILSVIGIAIVLAVALLSGVIRPVADLGRRVSLPLLERISGLPRWMSAIADSGQAGDLDEASRIEALQRQLATNVVDKTRMQALESENALLRSQAAFLTTSGFESVGARVISREVRSARALLLIDRGRVDRLEIGQPVIIGEGIFVGKISALQERTATVELVTDAHSRVAVSLLDQRHLIGVLEGRGNGVSILTYIPSTEKLARDQILVTAGTEDKVPPYLPVGIINAVDGKPTDPFLNATVDPLLPVDRILLVSVLLPR